MAPASRPILGLVSLIILAGGILFQFLVILSGGVNGSPENQIYFLQASNIANIAGARNPSRWTFFAVCGVDAKGHNANCGKPVPALPFDPPRNFGTTTNVPAQFLGTHKFYYLSRFMFAFYLIALFFAACALCTGVLALCSRLGGYLSGLTVSIALFFQTLAAALMTAWTVEGRNAFRRGGHSASLGKKAYGFTWGAMACFLIATVLFCVGGAVSGSGNRSSTVSRKRSTRSTRSRGSFLDTDSQKRVKDDYA
ncbi:SUR7-domain-containing protein [Mytilinidion resinicola]|uniref:SUR7-domain-containing protein n=1 Tax=Mytilinidion resinicola TaxID=574789 RepID=A0A6A6Y9D9_9PEZI|nr:SUR7-domain-containing protein [Mytilinidion resinicola]KAF2805249.1 SUR7-domain-containing protein [Mytilinidion resinicola]